MLIGSWSTLSFPTRPSYPLGDCPLQADLQLLRSRASPYTALPLILSQRVNGIGLQPHVFTECIVARSTKVNPLRRHARIHLLTRLPLNVELLRETPAQKSTRQLQSLRPVMLWYRGYIVLSTATGFRVYRSAGEVPIDGGAYSRTSKGQTRAR